MSSRRTFYVIYALSGCAALVYEVVWTRLLSLQMGHTVAAVSTVLAAFMAGMAAGAFLGGRYASRRSPREALQAYAWLEFAIAASALALPAILALFRPLLALAYANGDGGPRFAIVRVILSVVALGVPSAGMGATFPVASRWIVERIERTGAAAGGLYAANTIGAAAGAALAAFVLIPAFGLRSTTWVAAAANLLAGSAALWLAARDRVRSPEPAPRIPGPGRVPAPATMAARISAATQPSRKKSRRNRGDDRLSAGAAAAVGRPNLAAAALALTGFVALANEVAWTRVIALAIGPTTYAFGAMLAVFIAGLAIGSALAARVADRVPRPVVALAAVMAAIGAGVALVMPRVGRLPITVAEAVAASDASFAGVLRAEALLTASLLLPLTMALGATFPLALRVAARDRDTVARQVAFVYAMNTAGAIAGSLAGGFLLVPILGLHGTIVAASLLAVAGGAAVLAVGTRSTSLRLAGIAVAIAIGGWMWGSSRWDLDLLSSGAYKYAPYVEAPDLESALKAGTLLYYQDGAAATVSVRRVAGTVSLAIDGKVDASNAGDMLTQKLLGHLPLLLHPNPRRVAIIGLGSGVTLGAALRHPIERADMLEISREVVEASRFFDAENHGALADRRTRLIVGDGRSHLLLGTGTYDVIVSEPSNPWMAGIASLFTREFFDAARRTLAPDGILCQWAHTYDISDADLRSIAATFASVFPEGTMWLIGEGDVLFIGSTAPIVPRLEALATAFARPGVAADLAEVAVANPESLLSMFVGGPAELEAYARGAALQTDDRTALEFSAPRSIVGRTREDNAATLRALASAAAHPPPVRDARAGTSASEWRNRGRMQLQAEAYGAAYDAFARAIALDPADESAIEGLARAAGGARKQEEALALLSSIAEQQPRNVPVRVELSRLIASRGDIEKAVETVRPLLISEPDDPRPAEQVASVLADAGDAARLAPLVAHLKTRWPSRAAAVYYEASLAVFERRPADALRLADVGIRVHDRDARLHTLRGVAAASLGRRDEARQAFVSAIARDPRDPTAYVNLGLLNLETGRPDAALSAFAEALVLDPASGSALQGLGDALSRLGHEERAARLRGAVGGGRQAVGGKR